MVNNIETLKDQLASLQKKYKEVENINRNLNERLLELYSLYKISLTLSMTFDFNEIMKSIKDLFKSKFKVQQYSIMLLDRAFEYITIETAFGIPKSSINQKPYKFGEDIFGTVVETGVHIYVPDMEKQSAYSYHAGDRKNQGSFLCLPLIPENNQPIGVLNLKRNKINGFTKSELTLLQKIARQIAKVIDKTLLFQQTKELSITDELTKVYNRRYFNQRFEREVMRALRYRRPLTIAMLDIDHFKLYNDAHGHLMGDEVIKKVAHTLDSIIRKADILARYGGEEFVLILPEITKQRGMQAAEKFRKIIEDMHFEKEETQPGGKLTVSLGIATLPDDTTDANTLLELADKALYAAKKNGRNQVSHSTASEKSPGMSSKIHKLRPQAQQPMPNVEVNEFLVANA
ncbi:sensor domain-containing diguanylate cyclase [candidate division KSB1 bacterium]|nr:sensor domain-containing diguanylate cyclase [candidate division KSB1 bacterium]